MGRVILDEKLSTQLSSSKHQVEICDPSGKVLGFFVPSNAMDAFEDSEISDEELDRRAQEGGRTWDEIRADLEQKYGPST